jgi:hypothetical protein
VSSNYVQAELRQFDLLYDYFIYNASTRMLKKVKNSYNSLLKELTAFGNVSAVFTSDAYNLNPDQALTQAISLINQ